MCRWNSVSYEWFRTKIRFGTEAKGNSQIVYAPSVSSGLLQIKRATWRTPVRQVRMCEILEPKNSLLPALFYYRARLDVSKKNRSHSVGIFLFTAVDFSPKCTPYIGEPTLNSLDFAHTTQKNTHNSADTGSVSRQAMNLPVFHPNQLFIL